MSQCVNGLKGIYRINTKDMKFLPLTRMPRDQIEYLLEMAIGVDIQIDILGIARKKNDEKIFFIEAKKTKLTIRDLGQLWAYCKLVNPEEAFLMTSAELGSLNKLLKSFKREDLLDYGVEKRIKKMKVAVWNMKTNMPDFTTMVPKVQLYAFE